VQVCDHTEGKEEVVRLSTPILLAMGISGSSNILLALLGLLAASRSASALPWTVPFGGCIFRGDYDGAPLVRSGSCPTLVGLLDLSSRGITLVPADAFEGMPKM
jgi:hypothetical protein